MAKAMTFKHISALDRQKIVDRFLAAIKQMKVLDLICPDFGEVANEAELIACEVIGATLRDECFEAGAHGSLLFAKVILDHANTRT